MHDRRARLIAELVKHLEDLDGEELKGAMPAPAVEVSSVEVAELDPKKTKDFEDGFKGALGVGKPKPEKSVDVAVSEEDEMDDDEFEELVKMSS